MIYNLKTQLGSMFVIVWPGSDYETLTSHQMSLRHIPALVQEQFRVLIRVSYEIHFEKIRPYPYSVFWA